MHIDTNTRRGSSLGFSLIEIMVTVSLMSVIIFGLYSMFNQTQKALRMTNAQVDVLEAGRGAMDILSREIEQATYTGIKEYQTTVLPRMPQMYIKMGYAKNAAVSTPLAPRTTLFTSNVIDDFFFMTRPGGRWAGNGFFVATSETNSSSANLPFFTTNTVNRIGVGTLYRYSEENLTPYRLSTNDLLGFNRAFSRVKMAKYDGGANTLGATRAYPLIDGVVHLRLTPYDSKGRPIIYTNIVSTDNYWKKVMAPYHQDIQTVLEPNSVSDPRNLESQSYFQSNSLPAYIDVELGILESQIHERIKSIPNTETQLRQLADQAPAIHFFHKLIPIRNAQP
jgi:prepilin-type N-terminal cleavage/methylation domain-containing protein